jgi:hypothetical protein
MLVFAAPPGDPARALTLGNTELRCDGLTIERAADGQMGIAVRSGRSEWRPLARCPNRTDCEIAQVSRDGAAARASGACALTTDGDHVRELDCRSYSAFGEVEMRLWPQ